MRPITLLLLGVLLVGCASTEEPETGPRTTDVRAVGRTPQEVIRQLQSKIASEPDNPQHYYDLGTTYEGLGRYDMAVLAYRKLCAKVTPDEHTGPYWLLGKALALAGKTAEAIDALKRCVAVEQDSLEAYAENSDYREAHFLLGKLFHAQGDQLNMAVHFRQYLELETDVARGDLRVRPFLSEATP